MNSASSIVGEVIHCVYTWLPRTVKNKTKERKKDPRGQKKGVNFSQIVKEQNETNHRTLESFKGSNRLPSTPDSPKVCLHFLPKDYKEDSQQNFASCNLEVVGYKYLSNEKKISKRSALKKWLRQRTNVVQNENFHLDERSHGTRHELCFREVFKCSPRLAGNKLGIVNSCTFDSTAAENCACSLMSVRWSAMLAWGTNRPGRGGGGYFLMRG